jgi:bile acid-coenzyme A ligase
VITDLAATDAGRTAVVCEGESVTRAELERRANRMARAFAAHGAAQGRLVTLALPNSVDLVVGCVAAWKLGAVPSPISHRLAPPERA